MLRFLLNVLWFVLGGVVMGLGWWLAGLVAAVTIVGIPWARACFVIGNFSFWPFGNEAVSRRELTGQGDIGTGPFGLVGNVIWFLLAGWWLAIGHLSSALACFITIIGIPFGIQHIKLALIALAPIGMQVVPVRRRTPPQRRAGEVAWRADHQREKPVRSCPQSLAEQRPWTAQPRPVALGCWCFTRASWRTPRP
jgi:uncharacterized membrane protein YccF (DUF307 family)